MSSPQEQKAQEELKELKIAYEQMRSQVDDKTKELTEANQQLHDEIAERKKMAFEIIEISQAEQRRFGSQLHDGLCQELTAILIFAKSLAQKMEKHKSLELKELKLISDMLLNAVDQARDTARGLYPGELEGISLIHSLEELTMTTSGANCTFICPTDIFIRSNNTATHLFRITQEAISNAIKHGKAAHIQVSFYQNDAGIILEIKDDGIGFIHDFNNLKGIGLKIMKNRAHMMNATFQVKANFPQGVILECILPQDITHRGVS